MSKSEQAFFDKYIETGIAYVFTFDIQEQNTIGGAIDPIQTLSRGGLVGVQFSASADYTRSNIRNFAIAEDFRHVMTDPLLSCAGYHDVANFSYPISGSIGMNEVIDTFINLNVVTALKGPPDAKAVDDKAPVFADTLTFTTTLQASATPSVTLSATGSRIGFAEPTNFAPLAKRTDKHILIVGLSFPKHAAGNNTEKSVRNKIGGGIARGAVIMSAPSVGAAIRNAPSNLTVGPLGPALAPARRTRPSSRPEDEALQAARDQLLLNYYSRFVR